MIHPSHAFDFSGRRFAFRHAGTALPDEIALRALAEAVEPAVVELTDEAGYHVSSGRPR